MDYTIYIILAVLAVIYFLIKGLNRKNSRDRKSRRFMDDHRRERHHRKTNKDNG